MPSLAEHKVFRLTGVLYAGNLEITDEELEEMINEADQSGTGDVSSTVALKRLHSDCSANCR